MVNTNKIQPAQYNYTPNAEEEKSPVMIRRKVKNSYSWASGSMLIQFAVVMIVMVVLMTVKASAQLVEYAGLPQEELMAKSTELTMALQSDTEFLSLANSVCYLIANLTAFIIGTSVVRGFKAKQLFRKSKLSVKDTLLGCLAILGLQGVSIFIQTLVVAVTGYSGVPASQTFVGKPFNDIATVVYFVIIAAVTEELLCRGLIMNALAPVDRKFALFASSLLFALMHGNFNQIFNAFFLGLLMGYIALKSGSLLPSILLHFTANANAMFCSYVYEYKLMNSIGEAASTYEFIHFGVLAVAGMISLVILIKRLGKVTDEDMVVPEYTYEVSEEDKKKLCWKTFLKCPTFWIVAVFYIGLSCTLVTPVA